MVKSDSNWLFFAFFKWFSVLEGVGDRVRLVGQSKREGVGSGVKDGRVAAGDLERWGWLVRDGNNVSNSNDQFKRIGESGGRDLWCGKS